MAQKFIVLGWKKRGGNADVIANPAVPPMEQLDLLKKNSTNAEFEEVQMFQLTPHTRAYHPQAQAKADAALKTPASPPATTETGPTVEEYLKAGYNPNNYPPQGYVSRSTPEEIKAACEKYAAQLQREDAIDTLEAELAALDKKELVKRAEEFNSKPENKDRQISTGLFSSKEKIIAALVQAAFPN